MGAAKACRVRDRFRAKLPWSVRGGLALNWLGQMNLLHENQEGACP